MSSMKRKIQDDEEESEEYLGRPILGAYTITYPYQKKPQPRYIASSSEKKKKVRIVSKDDRVYEAEIPFVPVDQLPPGVDIKDIDSEKLFKEIAEMKFPKPPPRVMEPTGRQMGGPYTMLNYRQPAPKLTFSPVSLISGVKRFGTIVLGEDGRVYQGSTRTDATFMELDRRIRGSKRIVRIATNPMCHRQEIVPTVVTLHENNQPC